MKFVICATICIGLILGIFLVLKFPPPFAPKTEIPPEQTINLPDGRQVTQTEALLIIGNTVLNICKNNVNLCK